MADSELVKSHRDGAFLRDCPKCGSRIIHKSLYARNHSKKIGKMCGGCKIKAAQSIRPDFSGERNPFFGKKHSEETRKLLSAFDKSYSKSDAFKAAVLRGMGGRTNRVPVYECWLRSYGQEEANRRLTVMKSKHSQNQSGDGNPMFGVPSPSGSGNGWKGWFDGHHFRSLRELSFMAKNTGWISAESSEFAVSYADHKGNIRNYFPDFYIAPDLIVECKPVRLWNTPSVSAKARAAEKLFSCRGWIYQLTDPKLLEMNELSELVDRGRVQFQERYRLRMEEYRRSYVS